MSGPNNPTRIYNKIRLLFVASSEAFFSFLFNPGIYMYTAIAGNACHKLKLKLYRKKCDYESENHKYKCSFLLLLLLLYLNFSLSFAVWWHENGLNNQTHTQIDLHTATTLFNRSKSHKTFVDAHSDGMNKSI